MGFKHILDRAWLSLLAIVFVAVTPGVLRAEEVSGAARGDRLNVLFIAVDDLRPALGCYGDAVAISPNIDGLAARGVVFNRAYCQEAVCSPSRLSLMTGRRPDTIRVWDLSTHFREALPDIVTLPQLFKDNGYYTASIGKIYHGSGSPSTDPPSWSVDPLYDHSGELNATWLLPENRNKKGKQASTEAPEVDDGEYEDGMISNAAVERLRELKMKQQSFFLAVGFRKPHLPFCAPKRYWDMYDRDSIPLPNLEHPLNAPELAIRTWHELEGYKDIPNDGKLSLEKVRELRHGYYACVSYVDANIGRVLDELDRLGLAENTIIVLWGDHGFHLGEQGLWTKANNYELATRAPLLVVVPGMKNAGKATDALVEFVDIYPTLADLCGLGVPGDLEGMSLKPILDDTDRPGKEGVFSQYPRNADPTKYRHKTHGDIMGYAVRTDRYRYVEWRDWNSKQTVARELYDQQNDPQEMNNVADDPQYAQRIKRLSAMIDGIASSEGE